MVFFLLLKAIFPQFELRLIEWDSGVLFESTFPVGQLHHLDACLGISVFLPYLCFDYAAGLFAESLELFGLFPKHDSFFDLDVAFSLKLRTHR